MTPTRPDECDRFWFLSYQLYQLRFWLLVLCALLVACHTIWFCAPIILLDNDHYLLSVGGVAGLRGVLGFESSGGYTPGTEVGNQYLRHYICTLTALFAIVVSVYTIVLLSTLVDRLKRLQHWIGSIIIALLILALACSLLGLVPSGRYEGEPMWLRVMYSDQDLIHYSFSGPVQGVSVDFPVTPRRWLPIIVVLSVSVFGWWIINGLTKTASRYGRAVRFSTVLLMISSIALIVQLFVFGGEMIIHPVLYWYRGAYTGLILTSGCFSFCAAWAVGVIYLRSYAWAREQIPICFLCNYDLRYSPSGECPECGWQRTRKTGHVQ